MKKLVKLVQNSVKVEKHLENYISRSDEKAKREKKSKSKNRSITLYTYIIKGDVVLYNMMRVYDLTTLLVEKPYPLLTDESSFVW